MNECLSPANQLAVTRTILANERTLLSYFRISLGSLLGGAGLMKFFEHPAYIVTGAALLISSAAWIIIGIHKYRLNKKLISDIDPEDWLEVKGIIKKEQTNGKKPL